MDNMLEHPGTQLQLIIKDKGLTQKAFASILGKKVSEVNELLKGKRNITIQRDYLLHQALGTPMKYRILKQVDYDYSLLDIKEISDSSIPIQEEQSEVSQHQDIILKDNEETISQQISHSERSKESSEHRDRLSEHSEESRINNLTSLDSSTSLHSSLNDKTIQNENKPQETPIQKPKIKNEEDHEKRAKIFKSF